MIIARGYQKEALDAILKNWNDGVTRQLVSLPTGCGKTVIFGLVVAKLKLPTLIIAHREELLYQAKQTLNRICPDADTGILKAGERGGLESDICIASVQTATRHTEELSKRNFKVLICDEAHHSVAGSYTKIFRDLGFMDGQPDRLLLGVTATAYRGDGVGLDNVFEKIVFERSILKMIKDRYLSDIRGLEVSTNHDISGVTTMAGDFSSNELSSAIDTPERNALIADTYLELGEDRRGVAFCVKVDHALHLAAAFRERGIACEAVYGNMDSDERQDVLKRFADNKLQILTNVGVLTEGWDAPDLSLILMARPTKSKGLFIQCVGRGLRLAPNKRDCLLIDFVDTARNHKLCGFGTLAGTEYLKATDGRTLLEIAEAEGILIPSDLGTPIINIIDLFESSDYVWHRRGNNYKLNLPNNQSLWCFAAVDGSGYIPMFLSGLGDAFCLTDKILPVDYAIGCCEDYVRRLYKSNLFFLKQAEWRGEPATAKQISLLRNYSVEFNKNITKGEAADLIDSNSPPPTLAQQNFLLRNGLYKCPWLLTNIEAYQIISQFKSTN